VQLYQSLDYPTIEVKLDREKAGKANATAGQVARSILAATASSRFVVPNYWPDPKTGVGYQVQVEVPQPLLNSVEDLGAVPVRQSASPLLLRDVATLSSGTMPGQYDRYNMKREISLTANLAGADLGRSAARITKVLAEVKSAHDAEAAEAAKKGAKPPAISH
jgi:multidrug efflux pump subunit AcrB